MFLEAVARWGAPVVVIATVAAVAVPALAENKPPVRDVDPDAGRPKTTFTFTYKSDGTEGFGGDQLYLIGPRNTRCHPVVAQEATGHSEGRQRIYLGPNVNESDSISGNTYRIKPRDPKSGKALARWCKGEYRGRIDFETGADDPDTVARFRFRVK